MASDSLLTVKSAVIENILSCTGLIGTGKVVSTSCTRNKSANDKLQQA